MTEHFDEQENKNRLLRDFHYAALGGRCRTSTYINPILADLAQYEWLEAECADGRFWDVKVMKATVTGGAPEDIKVQQTYLDTASQLNFGAMILKLSDYQKAQAALGYLRDESDLGALAGAVHFRDAAVPQGIVFDASDDPIASQNGLIRKSGTYAITAFAAVSTAVVVAEQTVTPEDFKLPSVVSGPPLTAHDRKLMTDCITSLNRITENLAKRLTYDDLLCSNSFYAIPSFSKSNYTVFVSQFDSLMAPIRANKTGSARLAQITQELDFFAYQVFRMLGQRMKANFESGQGHYSDKKTNTLIDLARERCMLALEKSSPGASSTVLDLFAYETGADVKEQKSQDMANLRRTIDRIQHQLQGVNPGSAIAETPVGIQPDTPWPRS